MKYLKRFESLRNEDGVMYLVNNYLSYLLDNGFKCEYTTLDFGRVGLILECSGNTRLNRDTYKWSDVSSDFIPFLYILDKEYHIECIHINRLDHKGSVEIDINNLLDDSVIEDTIYRIYISIEEKIKSI